MGYVRGEDGLSVQNLATLDVAKLTPLSPEVISRQATINIGACCEMTQSAHEEKPETPKKKKPSPQRMHKLFPSLVHTLGLVGGGARVQRKREASSRLEGQAGSLFPRVTSRPARVAVVPLLRALSRRLFASQIRIFFTPAIFLSFFPLCSVSARLCRNHRSRRPR